MKSTGNLAGLYMCVEEYRYSRRPFYLKTKEEYWYSRSHFYLKTREEYQYSSRGSGGKNVIFSNGPNSTFECFNIL
jgi:hypothetical protein